MSVLKTDVNVTTAADSAQTPRRSGELENTEDYFWDVVHSSKSRGDQVVVLGKRWVDSALLVRYMIKVPR